MHNLYDLSLDKLLSYRPIVRQLARYECCCIYLLYSHYWLDCIGL